jgi:5-methylcytosine-specific restriction endonuclease McrA
MPHANPDARRAYAAKYRKDKKEQIAAYQRRYLEKNPDRRTASVAASNASEMTKQKKAEYRERNRDALRAAGRAYVSANRAKSNEALARYRAAKKMAIPLWADAAAIKAIYAQAREKTEKCGVQHHVDHIIPLVSDEVCGLHVAQNLQVLLGRENQRKGNRIWPREM